jgi:transposase
MKGWGKSQLTKEKIAQVIESAAHTLGQPCIDSERRYLQALAEEMYHSRCQQRQAKRELEAIIRRDDELVEMATLIGMVTVAVLMSCHLDPRNFACPRSYQKALGLNLKERSSGRQIGQLKLTKRGSGVARRYLYFATLRLIDHHPVVKQWYQSRVDPRARKKMVIALMRKLSKALWHVARGERFDANKLLTIAKAA